MSNKPAPLAAGGLPWKILIADDDADVHEATRLALRGTRFRDRPLEFIDAYSAVETLEALRQHPDMAVVFLDVIMETDSAGLGAARQIRASGFNQVRIIIRTGFPGQAPERQVIVDYDIHDYKEKSELTVQKLFTTTISALRAYSDVVALENHRRSLMSVLESVSWFDFNGIQRYIAGMLAEFSNLTGLVSAQIAIVSSTSNMSGALPKVVATLGDWKMDVEISQFAELPPAVAKIVLDTMRQGEAQNTSSGCTLFSRSHGLDLVIFAAGSNAFSKSDNVLLEVFMSKVCQALSNQASFEGMMNERNAIYKAFAVQGEGRDVCDVANLDRVNQLVVATVQRLETTLDFPEVIDDCFKRDIGIAATLHDLGNQVLPQGLLNKPSGLSAEERRIMQSHVEKGLKYLSDFVDGNAKTGVSVLAQQIIAGHHEHFDGSGYPSGLQGDAIPLAARVVAVVDSFTAMTTNRPYRAAMSVAEAIAMIKAGERGKFDPVVVQAFLTVV